MSAAQSANGPSAGRWVRIAGWLPVALLLAGVANHVWQVRANQLSPWLGAGFGMFASTDVGSVRRVEVFAVLADGTRYPILLGSPHEDLLRRARDLPTAHEMERLAGAARAALAAQPEIEFPEPPRQLRVEVWRNRYQPGSLRASSSLIATRDFPFEYGHRGG
jgi:hypothetical protein